MRILIHTAALLIATSCTSVTSEELDIPPSIGSTTGTSTLGLSKYDPANTFPNATKDTLLANLITFIHKRPEAAINRDRTGPEFRMYFVEQLPRYRLLYHQRATDGTDWYYLIRPARSVHGALRGVGGRFRADEALQLVEFEEIFNTPVLPEQELEDKGRVLFEEMIATGAVDTYANDRLYVEWPDERLKYDKERREWRYKD